MSSFSSLQVPKDISAGLRPGMNSSLAAPRETRLAPPATRVRVAFFDLCSHFGSRKGELHELPFVNCMNCLGVTVSIEDEHPSSYAFAIAAWRQSRAFASISGGS